MKCKMKIGEIGVSIIIPAYNAEKTLQRTVDSVLNQTHSKYEILIIDDCSSDDTWLIVEDYMKKSKVIRGLRNEVNEGVSISRNKGVEAAQYEWICFLDSDDFWEKEKLQKQLELMKVNENIGLFYTGSAFVDDEGRKSDYTLQVPQRVGFQKLLYQNIISCSSVMVRKDLLLKYPMKKDRMIHEDYATWLSILREIPYAMGVNEPLLIYQVSSKSKSGNKKKAAIMQWRTYECLKLPLIKKTFSFFRYMINGLKKYFMIKIKMH